MTTLSRTPDDGGAIAVGVPFFSRTEALGLLLDSVPQYVETVYVADNGDANPGFEAQGWPFTLEWLELDYDIGIGACRAAICEAVEEPYLWVGDSDMEFTRREDLRILRSILETHDDLGGVSGWLLEDRAVRAGARDLRIDGDVAIKTARTDPALASDPVPHVRFDFIPQAGLFRMAAFDDYSYDPEVRSTEHFDFFMGHKQHTEWQFASTPTVTTIHNRNIDREYRESKRGGDHNDHDILAEKWGIERVDVGAAADWAAIRDRSIAEQSFDILKRTTPPAVWLRIKAAAEGVGLA